VKKQAEHRFRAAAGYAVSKGPLVAALLMNAPALAVAAVLAWIAMNADEPAAAAVAWIFFAMAAVWVGLVLMESWRVMRRFARRAGRGS
jgi:chromate transport protein ChrA